MEPNPGDNCTISRRYALAGVGSLLPVSLAGCGAGDTASNGGESTATETPTPTEVSTPTAEPTPTETITPTPSRFPETIEVASATPTVDGSLTDTPESGGVSLTESGRAISFSGSAVTIEDLSVGGRFWLSHDDEHLYLQARIEDDVHYNQQTGNDTWKGDNIQFGIKQGEPADETFGVYNIALTPEGPQVWRAQQPTGSAGEGPLEAVEIEISRDDEGERTAYEVAFPWSEIEADPADGHFATSFLLNENDGFGREAGIEVGAGIHGTKNAAVFLLAELA
jgi:hypothetical protein